MKPFGHGEKVSAKNFLLTKKKKYLSKHVFSPLNICRAMDLFGGMLNLQSLQVLRWIKNDATQDRSNVLFPSPTTVSHFISNFTGFCTSYARVNFFTNKLERASSSITHS